MNRIVQRFANLKEKSLKGFVVYIGAGDPNLEATRQLAISFDRIGVDVLDFNRCFRPLVGATVKDDDLMTAVHEPANQMDSGRACSANHQCACHVCSHHHARFVRRPYKHSSSRFRVTAPISAVVAIS